MVFSIPQASEIDDTNTQFLHNITPRSEITSGKTLNQRTHHYTRELPHATNISEAHPNSPTNHHEHSINDYTALLTSVCTLLFFEY